MRTRLCRWGAASPCILHRQALRMKLAERDNMQAMQEGQGLTHVPSCKHAMGKKKNFVALRDPKAPVASSSRPRLLLGATSSVPRSMLSPERLGYTF